MSISSLSFAFFNMTSAAPAPKSVASASPAANDATAPAPQACQASGQDHGRRNVLYEAMMAALREMGLTSDPTPPAPAAGTPSPQPLPPATSTPAAAQPASSPAVIGADPAVPAASAVPPAPVVTTTPPAASVEDAVYAFAHALWQAVRGGDHSEARREHHDGGDNEGHHGHRHHGRGEGFALSRGYAGLATRLESLAVRLDSSAAAADAAPAAAVPPDSSTAAPAVEPTPAAQQTSPANAPAANPAPASPLSQAFDAMMSVLRALNPNAPPAGSASPTLASFLHSLARGLQADHAAPPASLSGVGIVINISA